MTQITPTRHEKLEWSRVAQYAYGHDRNDLGHTFSAAASLSEGAEMLVKRYDHLMTIYRAWLNDGALPPLVPYVEVNMLTECGVTQRLSRSIRVF